MLVGIVWVSLLQYKVQYQLAALSLSKGRGDNFIGCKYDSYSREQLVNLKPSFNMRLLNTEQLAKMHEYGLK